MNGKDLYDAVEFVGHDLIDLAEKRRFTRPFWQTALPVAAMIALLLGVGITLPRPVPAPDNKTLAGVTIPAETDTPETISVHPLNEMFPVLEEIPAGLFPEVDWSTFYLNEAGLDDDGTELSTIHGDQVLAIDTKNGILMIRVKGEGYQGVLAIANDPTRLSLQASSQIGVAGETVGTIAEAHHSILAVNGSHFLDDDGAGNGGHLAGYAMCDGTEYNADARYGIGYSRLEIDSEGTFSLINSDAPVSANVQNAVEGAPILIQDGKVMVDENCGYLGIHPRTCIGQAADGAILLLVIEGRMKERSLGTDVIECARILQRYDCKNALNLDGGTSSILWYDGAYVTQCSNQHLPEGRPLPNAFVVERAE